MLPTRYALITGAASGLGRALALRLARDGWQAALADCNLAGLEQTQQLIEQAGGCARVEALDVRDAEAWRQLRTRLEQQWPRLDLLVNNAGVCAGGPVGECPIDDWRWVLDVNLHGVYLGCHTMIDWLKQNDRRPHLVNVASIAAFLGAPEMPAYNAAKAGVVALSETLYAELAPLGVGVSVVCPGFVGTQLLTTGRFSNERVQAAAERYMRQAQITPDDVAAAIVRAIARRRLYVVLGWRARLLWRFKRWFPRTLSRLMAAGYRRELQSADSPRRGSTDQPRAERSAALGREEHQEAKP